MRITEDKEPWSITFAANDPVNAVFDDNTIRFAIRGRRFENWGEPSRDPSRMEMSAVYTMEKTPDGARLVRQGDVSVDYIDKQRTAETDEIVVRTVMREKFEALFAPEFDTTGIAMPGRVGKGRQTAPGTHRGTERVAQPRLAAGWPASRSNPGWRESTDGRCVAQAN